MITSCNKIIYGIIQSYFRNILKHFENINKCSIRLSSKMWGEEYVWLFRDFLPNGTYFTKEITISHRNTFISYMVYLEFAFKHVCIVSERRLFVNNGNLSCMSEPQISWNHNNVTANLKTDYRTFQNLFDLRREYCYGLLKSSKYCRNILTNRD